MIYIEQKQNSTRDLSLFGAFSRGDTITFVVSADVVPTSVTMVIHGDGWGRETSVWREYPLAKSSECFTITLSMQELCTDLSMDEGGLFYYHYRIVEGDDTLLLGGEEPERLTPVIDGVGERQLLVYAEDDRAPEPVGGIMYHIFVDRFRKTGVAWQKQKPGTVLDPDWENGTPQYGEYPGAEVANNVFFGGDLYGIAEKLPYIASLGTSILYLSPIFEAASNHKYDTADYLSVDRMFGGDKALRTLCTEAKKFGIRVILDGVFNHTGADSIYFNKEGHYDSVGAYQSESSPYANWYTFRKFPDDYECWWGVKILPRVRSDNAEYQKFIFEKVIPKWRDIGVYGWRLDVADELDEGFLTGLRSALQKDGKQSLMIGEVWEDASDKVSYGRRRQYLYGRELDGVMNYPLREAVIRYVLEGDVEALRNGTERLYRRYPKWASEHCMNILSTHDTIRILTALGGEPMGEHTNAELATMHMTATERKIGVKRLKLAYGLLAALPGIPCVFYGDEVGMEGYRDPFCRRPFPWHQMDEELLQFYRKVGQCRKREPVLSQGELRLVTVTETLLVFTRTLERENHRVDSITVYLNRGEEPVTMEIETDMWELLDDRPMPAGTYNLEPGQVVWGKRKM